MATFRAALSPPEGRPKRPRFWAWLAGVRDRFEYASFSSFDSALALTAVAVVYLLMTAFSASRHLSHDELFTYYIANSASMARFWQAVHLDLNPPLSYLAVRASLAVLGDNIYATRFPSMLGYLIGSLCFYRFVSNRLRPAYGLLAMLVFWSTPFLYFSAEARPYGLVIGFFGIAMLAWQAGVESRRKGATLILGLAITGMMLSHFFTVFYIVPFGLAELVRWYRSRKFDLLMWAALLLPLLILFAYIPTMGRYEASVFPSSFQASPVKMVGFFYRTLEPESLVLVGALCLAMLVVFPRKRPRIRSAVHLNRLEAVFVAGLLAIPIVVNLSMMRSHGVAFHRYSGPAVFAYGIAFAFFLAAYTNTNRLAASVACCILLIYIVRADVLPPVLSVLRTWRSPSAASIQPPLIQGVRPDLPLVAASGLTFLEMDRYANPSIVSRLYYLNDRDLAIRYAHATIFEALPMVKQYFPIRATVEPYRKFVREHREFLVLGTPDYPEDWLLRRLFDIHAVVKPLGNFPGPYKDTTLYEVTMPDA